VDFAQAIGVLAAFARHRVDYVRVGSMAMAAQGLIRATRDMDVFVDPDPANVDRLKAALRELFEDPSIEEIRSSELSGDYPALQYVPPSGDYWIDILARLGEAFRYADLEAAALEVEGVHIRVATPRIALPDEARHRSTTGPARRRDVEAALRPRGGMMPVRKFRSVEEMETPPWREPLDPGNLRLACDLSQVATRLRPRRFPPGLHKYRSVEEASLRRQAWEAGTG
jgi:hypothetical protein